MNAKTFFFLGIAALICLPAPIAFGGSRGSHSSFAASRSAISRPTFSGAHSNFAPTSRVASNRASFTPRVQGGSRAVVTGRSATGYRLNRRIATSSRISTSRAANASASARHWSGNGSNWHRHHRHHHRNVVFVGGFYPYSWYYPWYYPYDYGYYPYTRSAVYDSVASYEGDSLVAEVQRRLASAGYYHGAIDGLIGPQTRRAIRAFERAHGLRVDGLIDDEFLSTMDLG